MHFRAKIADLAILVRILATASVIFGLVGVFLASFESPKPKALDMVLALAIAIGVGVYATFLLIKANRSPKTLAGFSISYHVIAIGLAFLAWLSVWLLAVLTGALSAGGLLSTQSSLLSSQASSSASSATSLSEAKAESIKVFFILYTISALSFLIFGTAKIVFSILYMNNHEKWKKAYMVLTIATAAIWLLAIAFLSGAAATLETVQSGFLPPAPLYAFSGLSLLCLFAAQDVAVYSGPEMNFSFESGLSPKE